MRTRKRLKMKGKSPGNLLICYGDKKLRLVVIEKGLISY